MAESGATPRDYGLRVQSHPVLLVTSPLKMRTAKNLQLSFSGELLETVSMHSDEKILGQNLDTANKLIAACGTPHETNPKRVRGDLEQRWGRRFVRTHRSALVARHLMQALERTPSSDLGDGWVLRVQGVNEVVPVSRRQLPLVRQALGQP